MKPSHSVVRMRVKSHVTGQEAANPRHRDGCSLVGEAIGRRRIRVVHEPGHSVPDCEQDHTIARAFVSEMSHSRSRSLDPLHGA